MNIDLDIPQFLDSGAILRTPEGRLFVWKNNKSLEKSIGYCEFFASYQELTAVTGGPQEIAMSEFRQFLSEASKGEPRHLTKKAFSQLNREHFETSFREIQRRIQRGEIEKAVTGLFVESKENFDAEMRLALLSSLLETQQPLFIFGFWHDGSGVIGATPEILFHQKNSQIRTMALAGTRPAQNSERLPLLRDQKEMREHQLVVQDIKQRLEKFGPVKISATEEVSYQTLFHLRTWLEVASTFVESRELVRHLHPTPALGVSPRNYGTKWMRELPEQADRGLYGGPVCFQLSPEESIGVVAIRSLFWTPQKIRVGVGCGLVEASELEREWDELQLKLNSIFRLMGVS